MYNKSLQNNNNVCLLGKTAYELSKYWRVYRRPCRTSDF